MYRVDRDEYFLLPSATTGIVSVTSKYLLFEWTRGLKSVNEGFCHLLPFSLDFCPPAQPKEIEMSTIKNPKRLLFTSRAGTFYALGKWILPGVSSNLIMLQRSVEDSVTLKWLFELAVLMFVLTMKWEIFVPTKCYQVFEFHCYSRILVP